MSQVLESIRLALSSIWANKLRSLLTLLGNIVAVSSIITVVALNLNQTARQENLSASRSAAQAGISFVNDRLTNMVGQNGHATTSFEGGNGKVKIGDTVWLAKQADDGAILQGGAVVVTGSEHGVLKVRAG